MKQGRWVKQKVVKTEEGEQVVYQAKRVHSHSAQYIEYKVEETTALAQLLEDEAEHVATFWTSRLEYRHLEHSETILRVDWTEYSDGDTHIVASLTTISLLQLKVLFELAPRSIRSKISEYLHRYEKGKYQELLKLRRLTEIEKPPVCPLSSLFGKNNFHPQSLHAQPTHTMKEVLTLQKRLEIVFEDEVEDLEKQPDYVPLRVAVSNLDLPICSDCGLVDYLD